ncbi:hypothetical protein [Geomicrobium sp. JCM 19038]|uniref:hypothetical protein n=1 Tax=Geomicrobium sp. JCM 19038 TaxID=1460635 RepID=UPI00045F47BA|nr:hypothetical protein [Geomicrobium sp. JCM 19038]GAK08617.1 hypothetical protein JCM19038_2404 [Geomicrobium sp. JCM 19038]
MNRRLIRAIGFAIVVGVVTAIFTEFQLGSVHVLASFSAFLGTFVAWAVVLPIVERLSKTKGSSKHE